MNKFGIWRPIRRRSLSYTHRVLAPNRREDTNLQWRTTPFRSRKITATEPNRIAPRSTGHEVHYPSLYGQGFLPRQHVRLLTLHPGKIEEPIVCSLDCHKLDRAPPYKALSYVWGPQNPRVELLCNDSRITVGPNLAWALKRIRSNTRPTTLWVDALCIDQSNTEEKNEQVQWIRRIFSQAEQVFVALGPDSTNDAKAAIALLRRLEQLALQETNGELPWGGNIVWAETEEQSTLPKESDVPWDSLRAFLRLPWFTRSWILQEASSSASESVALVGNEQVKLSTIGAAITYLQHKSFHNMFTSDDDIVLLNRAYQIWDCSQLVRAGRPRLKLCQVLIMTAEYDCENPRDKIYSLLGITQEGLDLERGEGSPRLQPNYGGEVLDVYCQVARYIIESAPVTAEAMECLWWYSYRRSDDWPSWVPRWSEAATDALTYGRGRWVYLKCYEACAGVTVQLQQDSGHTLEIRGALVDRVSTAFAIDMHRLDRREPRRDFVYRALEYCCAVDTGTDRTAELALAVTGYIYLESSKEQLLRDFKAWLDEMQLTRGTALRMPEQLQEVDGKMGNSDAFAHALWLQVDFNTVYFTENHSFAGLGLLDIRASDLLCILFGCQVPVLLRPRGDGQYQFLGLCHVPALKDGRAIEMLRDGTLSEQWFEIV